MTCTRYTTLRLLSCLLAVLLGTGGWDAILPGGGQVVHAQEAGEQADKPRAKKPRGKKARGKKPRKRRAKPRGGKRPKPKAKPRGERGPAPAEQGTASEAAAEADSEVVREGDTEVKVMSFTGIDVEGRLKSPQLLYFVNRVRAEFDRPGLPHRSFMPELQRSTEGDELK